MGRLAAPLIFGLAGFLFAPTAALAQDVPTRVPTVTRLVKAFAELERQLDAAAAQGDAASIDKLLQDDFELRLGNAPGTPVPRQQWIDGVLAARGAAHVMQQIAVHDYGSVAVVSFTQSAGRGPSAFVVDVWKKSGANDEWRLATRYAASTGEVQGMSRLAPAGTIRKKF